MDTYRRSGIVAGVLFIAATAAGILSLFAQPLINAPDSLSKISANEPTVLAAAFLLLIMGWACAGIGISMYPVVRKYNEGLALGAAGFRIMEGVFHCIGALLILVLATLSRELISAGPAALSQFQSLGSVVREGRTWVGHVATLSWCIGAAMYYALFFRFRLVPRWLSAWGLVGITLSVVSSILVLFRLMDSWSGAQVFMSLPIAVQEMVLAVWLIIKGFTPSPTALPQR